ncbi:MAG: hypothetical protein IKM43_01290 [Clostridia bacterium]|nr:hypothetical protein [Clostridia bacterium]
MLETISIWGTGAALVLALLSVLIMCMLKKNILDILKKDTIIFDQNYALKKQAVEKAMSIIDEVAQNVQITNNSEFKENAKDCYNQLLLVLTDVRIAEKFAELTFATNNSITEGKIVEFKTACRKDMGLSTKHFKKIKKSEDTEIVSIPQFSERPISQPVEPSFNPPPARENPTMVRPRPISPSTPRPAPRQMAPRPKKPIDHE